MSGTAEAGRIDPLWTNVTVPREADSPALKRMREAAGIEDPVEKLERRKAELDQLIQDEAEEQEREALRKDFLKRHGGIAP
jgi:hypothetical protein